MTIARFRTVAATLIGFNVLGTILTWLAQLQKPHTSAAHSLLNGTEFTGPGLLMAIALVAFALTYSGRRWLTRIGTLLIGLWGAGFAVGEVTELFKHNVGISAGRWDVVLAGSALGLVVGIATALAAARYLAVRPRSIRRPAATPDPA